MAERRSFTKHGHVLYTPTPKARLELSPQIESLPQGSTDAKLDATDLLPVYNVDVADP